jgi:urease accessory protein
MQNNMIMSTDPQALVRLMTWLSPSFPTGGFSYSHGLEAAIANGQVSTKEELQEWISAIIMHGSIWNDCVLIRKTHGAVNQQAIDDCSELAEALAGSRERHLETMKQGEAFLIAAKPWAINILQQPTALPIAIGCISRANQIDIQSVLVAFLQSFVTQQIQAALRLMPLGQTKGLLVQKELEPVILLASRKAASSTLDDLGSNTMMTEIAAMQHETMASRIFRS